MAIQVSLQLLEHASPTYTSGLLNVVVGGVVVGGGGGGVCSIGD